MIILYNTHNTYILNLMSMLRNPETEDPLSKRPARITPELFPNRTLQPTRETPKFLDLPLPDQNGNHDITDLGISFPSHNNIIRTMCKSRI